jgi:hypothetical protein
MSPDTASGSAVATEGKCVAGVRLCKVELVRAATPKTGPVLVGQFWYSGAVVIVGMGFEAAERGGKTSDVPRKVPAVEIVTIVDSCVLPLDEAFEQHVREILPNNVKTVMDIRLVSTDS